MAILALIFGLIAIVISVMTKTDNGETLNIGLLQHQMMALHTGLALLIIAAIRWDGGKNTNSRSSDATSDEPIFSRPSVKNIKWNNSEDNRKLLIGGTIALVVIVVAVLALR